MLERRQNYSESQFFSLTQVPDLLAKLPQSNQQLELIFVPGSSLAEDYTGAVLIPNIVDEEGMTLGAVRAEGVAAYLKNRPDTAQQLVLIASGYQQLSSGAWHSRAVEMAHSLVSLGVDSQRILLVPPGAAWHGNTEGNLRDLSKTLQQHFATVLEHWATLTIITNNWQIERALEMLDAWCILEYLEELLGYLTLVSADEQFAGQSQAHSFRLFQLKLTQQMLLRTARERQGVQDIRSGRYQSQNGPGADQELLVAAWEQLEQAGVRVTTLAFLAALNDELAAYKAQGYAQ